MRAYWGQRGAMPAVIPRPRRDPAPSGVLRGSGGPGLLVSDRVLWSWNAESASTGIERADCGFAVGDAKFAQDCGDMGADGHGRDRQRLRDLGRGEPLLHESQDLPLALG